MRRVPPGTLPEGAGEEVRPPLRRPRRPEPERAARDAEDREDAEQRLDGEDRGPRPRVVGGGGLSGRPLGCQRHVGQQRHERQRERRCGQEEGQEGQEGEEGQEREKGKEGQERQERQKGEKEKQVRRIRQRGVCRWRIQEEEKEEEGKLRWHHKRPPRTDSLTMLGLPSCACVSANACSSCEFRLKSVSRVVSKARIASCAVTCDNALNPALASPYMWRKT
mmetsp:Transcript_13412/g.38662  ORF Transcript_13412/g.38662 Transcript_13412/m.38662 type:complete len:222 (+) Transcript_13412:319-984(+)